MAARPTVVKPAGRALLVAAAMCSFLAAASTPLFGQTLLAVQGNLPTPALPPGALPAASSTEIKAPDGQPSPASGGSLEVVARPPVPSPPATTGVLGASPEAANVPPKAQPLRTAGASQPGGAMITPDEVGYASWYGSRFHGRLTASGQIYDMNAMTAAHRTFPFGTKVRVTDLENGKSVVVTVNDRGPFVGGRIIDLSRAAAEAIGLTGQGVARVRLHVIELGNGRRVPEMGPASARSGASAPAATAAAPTGSSGPTTPVAGTTASASISAATSPTSPATAASSSGPGGRPAVSSVIVQVGAFRDLTNAVHLKDLLAQNGFEPSYEKWEGYTRVVLVPVPQSELAALRERLQKIGITSILVRHN